MCIFPTVTPKEPLSEEKDHKKVIEKGKPDDVPPGIKNRNVRNVLMHLSSFVNKSSLPIPNSFI